MDPLFGAIFWGKLLTAIGVWMHTVVSMLLVYEATGSTTLVGLANACLFLPQALFSPLAGVLSDRGHMNRLILAGRLMTALGGAALCLWFLLRPGEPEMTFPVIAICSWIIGTGFALGGPALQAVVPQVVQDAELPAAMNLNAAPMTLGLVLGPLLGVAIIDWAGPGATFAVSAVFYGVFVVLLLFIRLPRQSLDAVVGGSSLTVALRHVGRDPALAVLLLAIVAVSAGAESAPTLGPALMVGLGLDPASSGLIPGAFGLGAAVAFVVVAIVQQWIDDAARCLWGPILMALGLGIAALASELALMLGGFFVAGLGFTAGVSSCTALIQVRCPPELRGRIMALWFVCTLGSRPLGSMVSGVVGDALAPQMALVVLMALLVGMSFLMRPSRFRESIGGSRCAPKLAVDGDGNHS